MPKCVANIVPLLAGRGDAHGIPGQLACILALARSFPLHVLQHLPTATSEYGRTCLSAVCAIFTCAKRLRRAEKVPPLHVPH